MNIEWCPWLNDVSIRLPIIISKYSLKHSPFTLGKLHQIYESPKNTNEEQFNWMQNLGEKHVYNWLVWKLVIVLKLEQNLILT